jgi:hypothetical protein
VSVTDLIDEKGNVYDNQPDIDSREILGWDIIFERKHLGKG